MTEIDERTAKSGRTAATAEVIHLFADAETTTEETETSAPVDMAKKPAPAETAAPAAGPVEGTVITAEEWGLGEDPEGDKPWVNPSLKTPEGRKARAAYLQRAARRRARRWVARQATPRGVLQATVRGGVRVHRWTRGVESRTADAARERAELMARESARATRRAQFALMQRDQKKTAAQVAQQELQTAVIQATAARKSATRKFFQRAAASYGPLAGIDAAGYVFLDGALGLVGGVLVNLAVLARVGRRPQMDPEELEALEREEAGMPERFEVGMTVRGFEAMLREALTEDLKVAVYALRIEPEKWGFKVQVILNRQTPEKISAGLADLEACLPGVRTNSILLQQSAQARNECVLRIPGKDQWKAVPALPYRAPKSVTTDDIHTAQIGADMSGEVLALPFKRTNAVVVGKSRSGKSTMLRAALDALTAAEDRVVVGIDLGSYGSGFGPYRKTMHALGRTTAEAREILEWVLDIGMGRPKLFERFGMGLNWEASEKRPGITLVIDEFPALVTAALREHRPKPTEEDGGAEQAMRLDELVQQIAMTSAKSDVTLLIATQSVTKDRVKDNTWITELPVAVMCACDKDDIQQLAGAGAMAQGWRPDRLLPAMGGHVNDASVAYVSAGGDYSEPIPYRACILSDEEADERARERLEAGLPAMDAESLAFVGGRGLSHLAGDRDVGDEEDQAAPAIPVLLQQIRDLYRAAGEPSGMNEDELFDALAADDPDTWNQEQFTDEDDEQLPKGEVLALVLAKVLEPRGQRWAKGKYRPRGSSTTARGYRLKDLKELLGETPES
ncbi:hypothetical protein ABZ686_02330 [Streptomyces sp. NPDC006992]|uniref:hypothetical protein n=1 Tax=Streptomyces sp. NPDC006992 TaxID=3155601 RepID=UPI0033D48E4C